MSRSHLLAITIFAVGCSSHEKTPAPAAPAPVSNTTPATTPTAPAAPKAAALPPELAELAKGGTLQAGPFAWPDGGASAVAFDATLGGETKFVWHGPTGEGAIHLPREVSGGVVKDVTKDGKFELALFAKAPGAKLEDFDDHTMTWLIGIDPRTKKPARMWLLEMQVLGAIDEASLDKELATVGAFSAAKDTSPLKLIARLPDASPADLQALVGKQGLRLCSRQGEKKMCVQVAQKAIDAKKAKQIVMRAGVIAAYEPDPNGDMREESLQPPTCGPDEKNAKLLECSSSIGGPAGGSWVFEQTDGGLRLAEVWSWAEDS